MPYKYPFSDAGSDESVANFSTETNASLYPELLTRFLQMLNFDDTNNICDSYDSGIDDTVHREAEHYGMQVPSQFIYDATNITNSRSQ